MRVIVYCEKNTEEGAKYKPSQKKQGKKTPNETAKER